MIITDVAKRLVFSVVFNILLIQIVLAINGGVDITSGITINTDKQTDSYFKLIGEHTGPNKTKTDSVLKHATDTEVLDLTNSNHHLKATSPMTVTKSSITNNKMDHAGEYFSIDDMSDDEIHLETSDRFNITSRAIAAVTCLSLALVAYIGIVLWRNVIQKNYENREILLNEDDIGDINDEDMRHFEAACIEIEA